MSHLSLSLFGPFHASIDGAPLRFRTDNACTLLAYLAMHPGDLFHREFLAELLFPGAPPAQARTNLRQTLYRLRQALAASSETTPYLLAGHNSLGFNRETDFRVDVAEFNALLDAVEEHPHDQKDACTVCAQRLQTALALYQGDFLGGLALPNSPRLEDWRVLTQERLHTRAMAGLESLTAYFEGAQDYAQAIRTLRRILLLEPWREEDHLRLMEMLALNGQPSQALDQYEACRAALATEFGAEPSRDTADLAVAIRAGRFGPPAGGPKPGKVLAEITAQMLVASQLPKAQRLCGRETELATLAHWLRAEDHQIVAILGMGGIGKTALAAHIAQTIAAAHPASPPGGQATDGQCVFEHVLWRSLVNAPPLADVLTQWLQDVVYGDGLGNPTSTHDQVDLLVAYLGQRPTLLVLDNLESILDQGAQTGQLRAGYEDYAYLLQAMAERSHRGCLLITSREEPNLLASLARSARGVYKLQLPGLSQAAGRSMLQRWSLLGGDCALNALNDRYSGNPLALELVAETIDELYGGDVAAFLALPFAVFETVEDVLNQQFERLTDLERRLLFWMAVEREARTVHELSRNLIDGESRHSVLVAMRRLLHRSLVEQQEDGKEVKFYLQNVINEFLTERLVRTICREMIDGQVQLLHSHALLKATAEDYVVKSQQRMIVGPVARRLLARYGIGGLRSHVSEMVAGLRTAESSARGYAAGTLLNLMLHAGLDLRHMDFSGMALRHADLQNALLSGVNFKGATFYDCRFSDTFAGLYSAAVSPDGSLLAATTAMGTLRLWRRSDGVQLVRLPIQPGILWSVGFSQDGQLLAAAGDDAKIYLFRLADKEGEVVLLPEQVLVGHEGTVRSVTFCPVGQNLASAGVDGTVRLWRKPVNNGQHSDAAEVGGYVPMILVGHTDRVFRIVYSPDGRLAASAGADTKIRVWDAASGRCVCILSGHRERIAGLAFSPDNRTLASACVDTEVRIWHVDTGQCTRVLEGNGMPLLAVAFSPDGRFLASAGYGSAIFLREIHGWQPVRQLQAESLGGSLIWGLQFTPDSRELVSVGEQVPVQVWDLKQGLCRIRKHPWHVAHSMAVLHPSKSWIVTGSTDGQVRVWAIDGMQGRSPIAASSAPSSIQAMAIHPTGRHLAVGQTSGLIQVWDLTEDRGHARFSLRQEIAGIPDSIRQLGYSPDGRYAVACCQGGNVHFWHCSDGQPAPLDLIRHEDGHRQEALALAMHPQEQQAATAGDDRVLRLWNLHTGLVTGTLEIGEGRVQSLDYSPDGSKLLAGFADGTVLLVRLDGPTVLRRVRVDGVGVCVARFAGPARCIIGGIAGDLSIWQLHSDEMFACRQELEAHTGPVLDVRVNAEDAIFVSAGMDSSVRLWDLNTGDCLRVWHTPKPYAGADITGVRGLSDAQKRDLLALGAVEGMTTR